MLSAAAFAAPVSQTFTLQPGWNAVFLEIDPADPNPAVVFAAVNDLISVWAWNPRASAVEFIQNPNTLIPEQQEMLVYLPSSNPPEPNLLTNLNAIHGGSGYLIQLGGSVDVSWTVTGEPAIPIIAWKANSFNFVGFHLAGEHRDAGPLFADFFASSPAHADQEIYMLDNASGAWVLTQPSEHIRKGEAYWIYCKGSSAFNGPIYTQLQQGSGLHYGTVLDEQELLVKNDSDNPKTVTLIPSSVDPPLFYYRFDPAGEVAQWVALTSGAPLALTMEGRSSQRLRLGIKRGGLTADQEYVTNLEVIDSEGVRFLLPVSATGISSAGLWTGYATTNKVSQPALDVGSEIPLPVGSPFSFRLIIHHDSNNRARLLQNVIQMWQEGGWLPDSENPGHQIVDPENPGGFVLLSDDSLITNYSGAALRDGRPVGRRISSSAFAFDAPHGLDLSGYFEQGGTLTVTLQPPPNEVHPFRHQYHKDHADAGSYPVNRIITLRFGDQDADGNPIPGASSLGWGSSEVGGIYEETISGLHRDIINTQGTFLLRRASSVDELTTD